MNQFLSILKQLGVDNTVWIQLGFFLVCYFFLSQFLFKPYMANLEYRKKRTVGNAEEAARLNQSAESLAMDYQGQVKQQNEKVTAIYNKLKSEGHAEEDRVVALARAQANEVLEQTKNKIHSDIMSARESMKAQVPQISRLIASRVLGREIS